MDGIKPYNRSMELLPAIDLDGLLTVLFWALFLLLGYTAIGIVWGLWVGKLKDELGETPTVAQSFRRLINRSKSR